MNINEIEWQGGDGLESLATAFRCVKTVVETIEEKALEQEPDAYALTLVAVNMLDDLDRCCYRLLDGMKKEKVIGQGVQQKKAKEGVNHERTGK